MTTTLKAITAAAATMMIMSAPASAGQATPDLTSSDHVVVAEVAAQSADAGTFDDEIYRRSCDYFRKRAQWSMAHIWWGKYHRCLNAQPGS